MNISQNRLAIFLPGLYGGGAERTVLNLAGGLAGAGHAVDLVLAQAAGPYLAEVPKSVHLVNLGAARVLSSIPALVRYLQCEKPVALLSVLHANVVALWARLLASVPKRVVVCEQNTLSYLAKGVADLRWRLAPPLARWFYPWAEGIVAVSEGVADDLANVAGIPRNLIQVIYNPIVTPELQVKSKLPLDHPWFASGKPPVLLAVGRLTAQKDLDTLIQAWARVRSSHVVRLLILGEGEERPRLEALVRRLGLEQDVEMPGFVSNPYPYMAQASLFVLSSRWEGLPTVLVEAMFCGTPIVATDCPSGPQEILQGGKYGQLVPVGDVDAMAQAIERALDGRMPRPPRESWQPFELGAVVNQYERLLLGN